MGFKNVNIEKMRHKISVKELREWKLNQKLLYASSSSDKKRLYVTLAGGYEVSSNGRIVYETNLSYEAVEKYNNL